MTTDQLRYFLVVAKYKNFTRAANQLYIGQPALSRQIADLEQQFGVKLFIRNNRNVELTPAGEILQKEAKDLLDRIENIRLAMESAASGAVGRIKLATIGNISKKCSIVSEKTARSFPDIRIEIRQEEQGIIRHLLLAGEIDAGLTMEFLVKGVEGLEYRAVDTTRFAALIPHGHPLSEKESICLRDLVPYRKVIMDLDRHPPFFSEIFSVDDLLSRKNLIMAQGMNSLLLYVDLRAGIGIAPEFVVSSIETENYSVRYLTDEQASENVVIVWRTEETNPVVSEFVNAFCHNAENYRG